MRLAPPRSLPQRVESYPRQLGSLLCAGSPLRRAFCLPRDGLGLLPREGLCLGVPGYSSWRPLTQHPRGLWPGGHRHRLTLERSPPKQVCETSFYEDPEVTETCLRIHHRTPTPEAISAAPEHPPPRRPHLAPSASAHALSLHHSSPRSTRGCFLLLTHSLWGGAARVHTWAVLEKITAPPSEKITGAVARDGGRRLRGRRFRYHRHNPLRRVPAHRAISLGDFVFLPEWGRRHVRRGRHRVRRARRGRGGAGRECGHARGRGRAGASNII